MTRAAAFRMPPPPGEAAPEVQTVRERILSQSTRMFAERGFAEVTIREIAAAAGVEAPTIYHYFGDKRSLYRTACVTCFVAAARPFYDAWTSTAPAADRIRQFTTSLCHSLSSDEVFCRLLQRELIDHDPESMAELNQASFQIHFNELLALVKAVPHGGDPVKLTFSIFALAFGYTQLRPVETAAAPPIVLSESPGEMAGLILGIVLPQAFGPSATPG